MAFQRAVERLRFLRDSAKAASRIVIVAYGVLAALTWLRDNFASPATQDRYRLLSLLPHWGAGTWVAVSMGVLLVLLLEGSYRVHRARMDYLVQQRLPKWRAEVVHRNVIENAAVADWHKVHPLDSLPTVEWIRQWARDRGEKLEDG